MDLFSMGQNQVKIDAPLPEVLRPQTFEAFVGQKKVLESLEPFLKKQFLPHLILWGPPGTGKTTLAKLLANVLDFYFIDANATDAGAKVLREISDSARNRRLIENKKTLVFIDEIHRLNKSQQDLLLPGLEKGDFTLIGATTENPSYELNRALMSRCRLLVLEAHQENDLEKILENALLKKEFTSDQLFLDSTVKSNFIKWADGDARRLLLALEQILIFFLENSKEPLAWETLLNIAGPRPLAYDKSSDQHYDLISAFIKSLRGSDPDAALYWLARMIEGGENPTFIARRLVILASEDIGNADPRALSIAIAAAQAVDLIGLPEGGINLAHAVTYLASAPKSNRSYMAYNKALEKVKHTGSLPVPMALRSSKTELMTQLGYGEGYKYPHNHDKAYVKQTYLPNELIGTIFYEPSDNGFEKTIKEHQAWKKTDPK